MHTCIYIRDIYVHKYARKCIHARVCTHIISTHTTKSAVVTYVYTRIHVICVHIHVYMIYEYTHARTRTHAHTCQQYPHNQISNVCQKQYSTHRRKTRKL